MALLNPALPPQYLTPLYPNGPLRDSTGAQRSPTNHNSTAAPPTATAHDFASPVLDRAQLHPHITITALPYRNCALHFRTRPHATRTIPHFTSPPTAQDFALP